MPLVSVLMTAYNREDYIAEAIESVLRQTFTDFELIIVDDRSSDATLVVARKFNDPRIRIIENAQNLGDYPNRNHAATFAMGKFLKYHDSDDVMYLHCLEVMVSPLLAETSAGFALSASAYWHGGPCPMLSTPELSYRRHFLGQGMFNLGPACAMFRTDAFRELGGFPEVGPHSDLAFWLKACARTNVLLVNGNLFWYRIHAGQHLQGGRAQFDGAQAARFMWDALNSSACPLKGEELEQAKRNYAWGVGRDAISDLRRGNFSLAHTRVKDSGLSRKEWFRYFRRQRRVMTAGTPLGFTSKTFSKNLGEKARESRRDT